MTKNPCPDEAFYFQTGKCWSRFMTGAGHLICNGKRNQRLKQHKSRLIGNVVPHESAERVFIVVTNPQSGLAVTREHQR